MDKTNKYTTVPNQRVLTINKEPTDRVHLFTANNLEALDQAVYRLQTKGGFKLYMYLAKNQPGYTMALSSSHFVAWSGLGLTAYKTAFEELVEQGYLIPEEEGSNKYIFRDKSLKPDPRFEKDPMIKIHKDIQEFEEEQGIFRF